MRTSLLFLTTLACLSFPLLAQEAAVPKVASPSEAKPSSADIIAGFNKENPGVRIDSKNQWVEFDAKVCLRDVPMLEALVCTPMTKEHESILVSKVKPSQLHLALLLLGLEPGAPRAVRWVGPNGDQPQAIPARGEEVALFLVTHAKVMENGKEVDKETEVPAGDWLLNQKTKKKSDNNRWLFTGSRMAQTPEGKPYYWADGEGDMISIVHFGDETLAPTTNKTKANESEGDDLGCNTVLIPPVDTQVIVRVKKVPKERVKTAPAKVEASVEKSEAKPDPQ